MPFLLSTSVTKPSRAARSTPLQPIASALPGRNSAVRRFQNLREARSTRARNPSVQLYSPLPALCQVVSCISTLSTLGHETLLCTFPPLPLPCQVKILHLEGFKTCAKHVRPGPETLPCSSLPTLYQVEYFCFSPFAFALPGRNSAFRWFQNLRKARSTRAPKQTLRVALALCQSFARSNIAFRRVSTRHVSLGHETLLCTFRPLPLPCQVEILHWRGFQNLREARSTRARNPSVQL